MLCDSCKKLAILQINKKCIKCTNAVYENISVICQNCSAVEKKCSVCLKKIFDINNYKFKNSGCNCGGKK